MDYYVDRAVLRDWSKLFPLLLASGHWSWRAFGEDSSHLLQRVYVYEPLQQHFASPAEVALFVRESNKQHLGDESEGDDDSEDGDDSCGSTSDCDGSETTEVESSVSMDAGSAMQRAADIEELIASNNHKGAPLLNGLSFLLSNLGEEEEEVSALVIGNGGCVLPRLPIEHAAQGTVVVSSAVGYRRLAYIHALAAGMPIVHLLWALRLLRRAKQGSGSRRGASSSGGGGAWELLPLRDYLLSRVHAWSPLNPDPYPHAPSSPVPADGFLAGFGVINATGKPLWTSAMSMHGAYVCTVCKGKGAACADLAAVGAAAAALHRERRRLDLVVVDSEDVLHPGRDGRLRSINGCLFFDGGFDGGSPAEAEVSLSSGEDSSLCSREEGEEEALEELCLGGADAYSRLVRVVTEEWLSASLQRGAAADLDASRLFRPATSLRCLLTLRASKDRVSLFDAVRLEGGELYVVAALSRRHAQEVRCTLLLLQRCGAGGKRLRLGGDPPRAVGAARLGARVLLLEEGDYRRARAFAEGDRDVFYICAGDAADLCRALDAA